MDVAEASPNLLFDETNSRRLADVYAPCFTLILQLRASQEFGDAEVLRRRIKGLFDQAEREGLQLGMSSEDIQTAKFALIAFIDETILSSEWSEKAHWVAKPLQLEIYDRYDAGEGFFERLDKYLGQPNIYAEVLEVYYSCMTLGFKGRYQLHDQERLRTLIEETYAAMARAPGMAAGKMSPHGKPRGQAATEVRSKIPIWVIILVTVALALLIYLGMSLYMNSAANSTVDGIEQMRSESTL